ncbi:MAG: hypothetical protein IPI50_16380 [Saprospiraceae bacterium]|nr:hypothetical protein [Saprospiraceae bacterium]
MPRIILTMPFLFHYAGSVFDLSDRIGVLNWDPDERVREKLSYQNNRYFELPDNGKGQETKLPLNYTIFCPENLLSEMDLNSGPCRITSVSKELEAEEDPWYASDVPKGRGKVLMNDSELYRNNLLFINNEQKLNPDEVILENRMLQQQSPIHFEIEKEIKFDFSSHPPGFYTITAFENKQFIFSFTLIKCFPIVINYNSKKQSFDTIKTIW